MSEGANGSVSSEPVSFFRIVRTNPPTVEDFKSYIALGLRPPPSLPSDQLRQWEGISVFATANQARRQARRFPQFGGFIAELKIAAGSEVEVRRTNPRSHGHHTIWADPEVVRHTVVRVVAVEQ